jgi:hypothetical protein
MIMLCFRTLEGEIVLARSGCRAKGSGGWFASPFCFEGQRVEQSPAS